MILFWVGLPLAIVLLVGVIFHFWLFRKYIDITVRIFQEKPLFIVPFGRPVDDAEHVQVPTTNNLLLHGCYLRRRAPRKGVILFGLEYGSNCWTCLPYCEFLLDHGYDVFALETRGQGQSPTHPGYEPLQWVTTFELEDFRTGLAYLKQRGDADARGIGLFGLSKGGSVGLLATAEDPYVRCCAVDGAFAAYTTMLPYMRKWITIYTKREWLARILPYRYYQLVARVALSRIEKQRNCVFPLLEDSLERIAPRPLFMIHGGSDNYIWPEMARDLFERAREPKELWLVEGAKHNQAINMATDEYKARVRGFFDLHLAPSEEGPSHTNGVYSSRN